MANAHQFDYGEPDTDVEDDNMSVEVDSTLDQALTLHAFLASHGNDASPADLRSVLSTSSKRTADKPHHDKISTRLVECERVKASIGKALHTDGLPHVWMKFPRGQKGLLLFVPQSGIGVHIGGRN